MPVIGSRYAEALLHLTRSPEAAEKAGTILKNLSALWEGSEEFRRFMLNPVVPDRVKKETVRLIVKDADADATCLDFIFLLIDKERLPLITEIRGEYEALKNERANAIEIEVFSSEALERRQLDLIEDKYRAKYSVARAVVNNRVEPSLMGGVKIVIGDTVIDGTLSGRLNELLAYCGRP